MKNIFLDSGIILDFLTNDSSQTDAITTILTLAEEKRIKVFVSPFLFSDLYNRFFNKENRKKFTEKLRKLHVIVRSSRINNKTIRQALNSDINDFRISLEYYSARGIKKTDAIITHDTSAYGQSKIALFTPALFLTTLWNNPE